MANLKNSKKAIIVIERNRRRNQAIKSGLKTAIKQAKSAIASNDQNTESLVRLACKAIDKAANKGIIKKNTAARKKSSIMTLSNQSEKKETKSKQTKPKTKKATSTSKAKTSTKKETSSSDE